MVEGHDPRWGYTTLNGILNEDLCQALDQLISEALGVGRNPADRWRKSDDGIHMLHPAAFYGYFRDDHWLERGGNLETWLSRGRVLGTPSPRSGSTPPPPGSWNGRSASSGRSTPNTGTAR